MGEYGDDAVHETSAHVRARRLGAAHIADPLLMIVASHDTITLTDLALASYEQALEPKKLVLIPGGHFDPYRDQFPLAEARRNRMVLRASGRSARRQCLTRILLHGALAGPNLAPGIFPQMEQ
jgi:fermentation-respiration switch protein FrsA (DUF1100 family)